MSRKQPQTDDADRGSISLFSQDDRAIEGLPIRLVIAIVVGVAALTVMMTMLDGLDRFDEEELSIEFEGSNGVIEEDEDIEVKVTDENGDPVEGATVVVNEGTAQIEGGDRYGDTNEDGEVTLSPDINLQQGQEEGTLTFEIQPPSDSEYTGGEDLEELMVIESS